MEDNKNNPKKLWEQIKSLGYNNKSNSSPNSVINIDNENCYVDKKIAIIFTFFHNCCFSAGSEVATLFSIVLHFFRKI